jgi:ribosomal protein L16 Arg81 hydroxylase
VDTRSLIQGYDSRIPSGLPSRLVDIVDDPDCFLSEIWGRRPQSFECRMAPRLISRDEIWKTLECGLLVAPYFSVIRQDGSSASAEVTVSRIVQTRRMAAYADPKAIREAFASGQIIRLNQAEHWHFAIKALVEGLRQDLRADVRSAVLVSADHSIFADAHSESTHTFILQLEGETRWTVSKDGQCFVGCLRSGNALYLPVGYAQDGAESSDCGSLLIVITVQQPTARDFAELALARFMKSSKANEVAGTHHVMSVQEKVAWLRAELTDYLTSEDVAAMTDEAMKTRQRAGDV